MIKANSFIKQVIVLTSGTGFAQLAGIMMYPVLTRLYNPDQLGQFGVYFSCYSILVLLGTLQSETALIIPRSKTTAIHTLCLGYMGLCGLSILLFIGAGLYTLLIKPLPFYFWFIPAGLLVAGAYRLAYYWLLRVNAFNKASMAQASVGVSAGIWQILLGTMRLHHLGLILGDTVGRGVITLMLTAKCHLKEMLTINKLRLIATFKRFKFYFLNTTLSNLLNSFNFLIPPIYMTLLFDWKAGGFIALSQRALIMPANLIGQSVAQAYAVKAADLKQDPQLLRTLFYKTTISMALMGFIPFLVIMLYCPQLFTFFFGPDWVQAGHYAQILALGLYTQFVFGPIKFTLNALDKTQMLLLANLIGAVFLVLATFFVWSRHLTEYWAVGILSVNIALIYSIIFIFSWRSLCRM